MANSFYDAARHDLPAGTWNWLGSTLKATLVSSGYTYSASHTTLADLGGNILTGATAQTLETKTVDPTGDAAANSVTFSGVTAAQTCKAVVLYYDAGGGVTRLVAYYDTGAGFPLTTTGADITVDWNATPSNGTVFTVN